MGEHILEYHAWSARTAWRILRGVGSPSPGMRQIVLRWGRGLAALTIFGGCSLGTNPTTSSPAAVCDQHHDLGIVMVTPQEQSSLVLSHEFTIRNGSPRSLQLEPAGSSCGCTKPQIQVPFLPPGASTEVNVRIEAAGRADYVQEYALLHTGDDEIPELRLTLAARVLPRLEVSGLPAKPISIPRGQPVELSFDVLTRRLLRESDQELIINDAEEDATFTMKVLATTRRTINDVYSLTTTRMQVRLTCPDESLLSDWPVNRRVMRLVCGASELQQPVVWQLLAPIRLRPAQVFLSRRESTPSSQVIVLTADEPFTIRDAAGNDEQVQLDWQPRETRDRHELRLLALPLELGERPRVERLLLTIQTDHPQQPTILLPVQILNLTR